MQVPKDLFTSLKVEKMALPRQVSDTERMVRSSMPAWNLQERSRTLGGFSRAMCFGVLQEVPARMLEAFLRVPKKFNSDFR